MLCSWSDNNSSYRILRISLYSYGICAWNSKIEPLHYNILYTDYVFTVRFLFRTYYNMWESTWLHSLEINYVIAIINYLNKRETERNDESELYFAGGERETNAQNRNVRPFAFIYIRCERRIIVTETANRIVRNRVHVHGQLRLTCWTSAE